MSTRTTAGLVVASVATCLLVAGVPAAPASPPRSISPIPLVPSHQYADGAPPVFSGGFGEQSCHACHFHEDVNTEPGGVTIAGVPERFVAGEQYPITITLSRPGMKLGGFQLTARFKQGAAQAGTLAPAPGQEERLRIQNDGGVEYATQRQKGTAIETSDTAQWSLIWTAPPKPAAVVFNVAANAADADGTAEHDFVYTAAVETAPMVDASLCCR